MPRQLVISVGTSLLTNLMLLNDLNDFLPPPTGRPPTDGTILQQKIDRFLNFDCPRYEPDEYRERIATMLKSNNPPNEFTWHLNYVEQLSKPDKIKKHYNCRGTGTRDCLPAEISTLYHFYYTLKKAPSDADEGKDLVTLLCTESVESVACAIILKKIITENPLFKDYCTVPEENGITVVKNLNMHKGAGNWVKVIEDPDDERRKILSHNCGIAKLKLIIESFAKNENGETYLLRTGGYKEFSADLKLLAAEFCLYSLSLFENSKEAVETKPRTQVPNLLTKLFTYI